MLLESDMRKVLPNLISERFVLGLLIICSTFLMHIQFPVEFEFVNVVDSESYMSCGNIDFSQYHFKILSSNFLETIILIYVSFT